MNALRTLMGSLFTTGPARLSWRRLLVLVVATALLCTGQVDQMVWLAIAGLFIGGEAAERVAARMGGKAAQPPTSEPAPSADAGSAT
jgi:hypothetical protein